MDASGVTDRFFVEQVDLRFQRNNQPIERASLMRVEGFGWVGDYQVRDLGFDP